MWYVKAFLCSENSPFTICIVCGACKEGELIPLFTSKRKPNTPKSSRNAASKPQGISYTALVSVLPALQMMYIHSTDSPCATPVKTQIEDQESEPESDILILSKSLASTSLA